MKTGLDTDQLHYLKTVLGLDRVIVPEAEPLPELVELPDDIAAPVVSVSSRLIVLLPLGTDEFPLRGESEVLIDKMIRAMKLGAGDVTLISWNEAAAGASAGMVLIPEQANGRPILIFGHGTSVEFTGQAVDAGQWFDWNGARAMATFSPSELLALPDQKKLAWAHLQAVMKEL